ncbi:MAG: hypothetical protein ACAI44_20995 [Candidatus Sericytochromatia bacterium]
MKTPFDENERFRIRQAKQILRHLWKQSNISMDEVMARLDQQNLPLKKSTLSTWFSLNADNVIRPKEEYLPALVAIFLPSARPEQQSEVIDELRALLDYAPAPILSENLRNRLAQQLDDNLGQTLRSSQHQLSVHLEALEHLLEEIEPKIMDYDKGFPVIRLEEGNLKLLRQLLGKDREVHLQYSVEDGYEIPLTRVQSLETITEIINLLNEGSRLLRAYVERHMLEEGWLSSDLPRIEDFVTYCWEISDRLLHHNLLCRNVPALKRTLLRIMATCWGIRYILENQQGSRSEVQFQNLLQLKGKTSQADINCSVAVYMGLLARQFLRQGSPTRVQQALQLYRKSRDMLSRWHAQLNTEQEVFFYKKELANLCYDIGSLLLWHQRVPGCAETLQEALKLAAETYAQVLETVNLFYEGLTEQRSQHVRAFYVLSLCWSSAALKKTVAEINKLTSGEMLNQQFWFMQMVKTSAYSILSHRSRNPADRATFLQAAHNHLQKALLVSGLAEQTRQEIMQDYILHQTFSEDFALQPVS